MRRPGHDWSRLPRAITSVSPEIKYHIGHFAMLVDGHAEICEPILLEINVLATCIADIYNLCTWCKSWRKIDNNPANQLGS